jgi:deoxyribonuclease-4
MNLGAHMSIAGGLHLACERGAEERCDVIQLFVKNQRQWKSTPLRDEDVAQYRKAQKTAGIHTAFAHDTYLINMASPDDKLWRRSLDVFVDELERCEALGLAYLVTHPGSPGDAGEETGLRRMSKALNEAHRRAKGFRSRILLEITAGQGACIGWKFEQMKAILDGMKDPDRIGFCFDTCHAFAAGYDLSTPEGYERTFQEFDRILGLRNLRAFHVNDSKKGLGCRVDRHEHIGKGALGLEAFRRLMRDPRFRDVPKVLETPKENDMDAVNLGVLRGMASDI